MINATVADTIARALLDHIERCGQINLTSFCEVIGKELDAAAWEKSIEIWARQAARDCDSSLQEHRAITGQDIRDAARITDAALQRIADSHKIEFGRDVLNAGLTELMKEFKWDWKMS